MRGPRSNLLHGLALAFVVLSSSRARAAPQQADTPAPAPSAPVEPVPADASATEAAPAPATSPSRGRADQLFQRAKELLREGRVAEACPLLEASQSLDPAGGTLLNLSRCYEGLGRFASADVTLDRALIHARARGRTDVVDFIERERGRLAPRIDRIRVRAPHASRGAELTLDGAPLETPGGTASVAIDPGPHTIIASAPGRVPFRTVLQVESSSQGGRTFDVAIPALSPPQTTSTAEPAPSDDTRKWMVGGGWTALIGGGAALGVGGALGIATMATWSSAERRCPERACNDLKGIEQQQDASTLAALSTGFVVTGLALGGLGVTLLVAAPPAAPTVAVPDRKAQLVLRGALP